MSDPTPDQTATPPPASAPKSPGLKVNFSRCETPLAIRHVESHLIFGPLARHFPAAWVALVLSAIFVAVLFATSKSTSDSMDLVVMLPGLGVIWLLTRATLRQQAACLWAFSKGSLAVLSLMVLPMALGLWLRDGRTDLRPVVFLIFIWFPALEFIPRITPHQRYLTLARLALSIPLVIEIIQDPRNTWN
ncbi:MAG: hypothetical protein WBV37_08600 [Nocardioidaceae bacterium]